jgi:secondary thiamine-phosphate synthase enzyme
MVDVTENVRKAVARAAVTEGVAFVYTPHTTAAITINENADPTVQKDLLKQLRKLVPARSSFEHAEGNSDAHIKSSALGVSASVIVNRGVLALGRWQGIFLCEFDGPRQRDVYVQVLGEEGS